MSDKEYLTDCSNCSLAKTMEYPDGNLTQIGCEVERLDQFRLVGADVVLGNDNPEKPYFYKIDRFCNKYTKYIDVPEGMEPAEFARKRSEIKVDIIVWASTNNELSDIRETLDSLALQNPLPNSVKIVLSDPDFNPMDVWASIKEMDLPYVWSIWTPVPDRAPLDIIDDVVNKFSGQFYAVFDAGHFVRKDFLNRLEHAFNEDLKIFNVVLPYEDGQGMTFNRIIHKTFYGNAEATLISKIRHYARESGEDPKILEFSDLKGSTLVGG
jgi:cellulose synthase/poly-beta-1,6-N-acetylglucosamine synthase-like glycosyltransferase